MSPAPVHVTETTLTLPTYRPLPPDRNPMFLEKRVYQGSSGAVYPLPFTDRVADQAAPHDWRAVVLENEFVSVLVLPELGGRIHRFVDKTNGYDVIYHQPVIKPALVGLAGPWASGGIEFNWPQHHRPSTFLPAEVAIERHPDGAATVWLSEHDPMARMKGMHGVRLHPGRSVLELVVRAYNRTADTQTFLWWANVATRVHEHYQSFFPADATHVADHAKRATAPYPLCDGSYYGIDYGARARDGVPPSQQPRLFPPRPSLYPANDLSWYANIPVPTSYMCMGSQEDFFGGYDHRARAGIVHIANHHISPGKKQWTWGNHEFGYAWDRNLTDAEPSGEFPPYIELMAGVYTDNQPDFSFLQPGETKTWSQFWFPVRETGPACHATVDAAVGLASTEGGLRLGVSATAVYARASIRLEKHGRLLRRWSADLSPAQPFATVLRGAFTPDLAGLAVVVSSADGRELLRYTARARPAAPPPPPATEPPAPADVASADELFVIGLHLEQYRHATRPADAYWREALRRDPGDSRAHLALGRWHLRRGELALAETHLRASIARLTSRNPNPADGEPLYQLGRCLRHQADQLTETAARRQKITEAYAALYKATWNHAWQPASFHALAEIDVLRGDLPRALDHLDRALRLNADNLRARALKIVVLRQLARTAEAEALLADTLALDPLDAWARHLAGRRITDPQVALDLAFDHARAGLFDAALAILADADTAAVPGAAPLLLYTRAWLCESLGRSRDARRHRTAATKVSPDYCFPHRLDEIAVLQAAGTADPRDPRAPFFLGNLLYDRRRHTEAIALWRRAVQLEPDNAVAWRNLGIGSFNILQKPAAARAAYEKAFAAAPDDARLLFERDQLWKRLGVSPAKRLRELQRHRTLVDRRDDLSVELCALLNHAGRPDLALAILDHRTFQPWEGGEGLALGQHVRTHLALGRRLLDGKDTAGAITHFRAALSAPTNLGEARHLLANCGDVQFWLGCALDAAGESTEAHAHWLRAAEFKGDFQTMSVRAFSEMTYYSALSLRKLGRATEARALFQALHRHARALAGQRATIDYFATSLPTMLLFDDDLQARQKTTALFLEAQAALGLGRTARARSLLREVLARDPAHALAADLLA